MKKIVQRLTDLVGNTPLLELNNYSRSRDSKARVIIKLKYFSPASSVKDHVVLAMIEDAEAGGLLEPGVMIIEPTSGNTGVGLTFVVTAKDYKLVLTIPGTMSMGRRSLLKALRAKPVLAPGTNGTEGTMTRTEELKSVTPDSLILQQFDNHASPAVHERIIGQETWQDADGRVNMFAAGIDTGGIVSGVGTVLRKYSPEVKVIAVEPEDPSMLSERKPGLHKIQDIDAGFVLKNYNDAVVDRILQISNDDTIRTNRELVRYEGLLVGISSGAAVSAATELAQLPEDEGKNIVVLLPDTGERYLSILLYIFEEHLL